MSDTANGFDAFHNRQPPKPDQTLGATGKVKTGKPKTERISQVQLRCSPEIRRAIKKAAADNDTSMSRFLENCFLAYQKEPQKTDTITVPAATPKPTFQPDPRDKAAGLTALLELWGDDITKEGFERIAEYENTTISQIVRVLLIEKLQQYEKEEIDIGLIVKGK